MGEQQAGNRSGNLERRPTIGWLTTELQDFTAQYTWQGMMDAASDHGAHLIVLPGQVLRSFDGTRPQANVLYDLVAADRFDGLVISSGTLSLNMDHDRFLDFCHRYAPLPLVSLEVPLEGIPSVLMDDYEGMCQVVSHLVETHGCRRIAFIQGPETHAGAQERYRAYRETLELHSIEFDSRLVTYPGTWSGGQAAVEELLDGLGLTPGTEVDALVSANALMAMEAIAALQARGVRVPEEVAVAGFDDPEEAQWGSPPLTTVQPPFYEMGYRAAELVLAQARGEPVPQQVVLPAQAAIRQSCGCVDPIVAGVVRGTLSADAMDLGAALKAHREEWLAELGRIFADAGVRDGSSQAAQLLDGLTAELTDDEHRGAFLSVLGQMLCSDEHGFGVMLALQQVISAARHQILPYLLDLDRQRAEDLWQQGRIVIGAAVERARVRESMAERQRAELLRDVGIALTATFEIRDLVDVLVRDLSRLGFPSAFVSLYEDPAQPSGTSQLILAYDEHGAIEYDWRQASFDATELVPADMLGEEQAHSLVIEPLYFGQQQIGTALLKVGPREGVLYGALGAQISAALRGALLLQERQAVEAERERLVESLARRTTQLQTAAEVSRAANSILHVDEMVQRTVELIQTGFGLYYVGLFLVDERGEWAVLRAGTGEPGSEMVAQGHRLAVGGNSMIGQCVLLGQARIASDTGDEAQRFENPLLPETRSEMALPLTSRGQALGAISVQSERVAAFSEEDIVVLQSMAEQLATTIDNIRLLEETQLRVDRERRVRTIADHIRRGMSREAILRIALEEVGEMLGASQSVVHLGTDEQLLARHPGAGVRQ